MIEIEREAPSQWSDERHAERIVTEFIRRDLLPESGLEEVAAHLADDEPMRALRKALEYN